jgi:hypothetical protein
MNDGILDFRFAIRDLGIARITGALTRRLRGNTLKPPKPEQSPDCFKRKS